jgi:hypothetical protein
LQSAVASVIESNKLLISPYFGNHMLTSVGLYFTPWNHAMTHFRQSLYWDSLVTQYVDPTLGKTAVHLLTVNLIDIEDLLVARLSDKGEIDVLGKIRIGS